MPQEKGNKVERLIVGSLSTNCYLFYKNNGDCLIIDPGDDAEYIINRINDLELVPKAIIATHGHYDHTIAANELRYSLSIPFLINKKDEKLLKFSRKSANYFLSMDPGPSPEVWKNLLKEKRILASFDLKLILTPGHTPGSVCLYSRKDNLLFCGDLIFKYGTIGEVGYSYSDKKALLKSIDTLLKLPNKTIVFPGHGEITTIGQFEKDYKKVN